MFAGLESTRENPVRRWTAMLSFTVQAAMVAAALLIPRLSPQSLPDVLVKRRIFVPMFSAAVHVQPGQVSGRSTGAVHGTPLIVNSNPVLTFRQTPTPTIENENPQAPNLFVASGTDDSVLNSIAQILARPVPYPVAAVRPSRVSVMMEGNLVDRVEPIYPTIAKQAGIEGTVVIEAIISRTGRIEQEQILSGHPLLARAALDAVRRWKYRPYVLDGEAVEVDTQVMVRFVLNR
jgi:periplasmic protein TonB